MKNLKTTLVNQAQLQINKDTKQDMSDDEYHEEEQLARVPSRVDISEEPEDLKEVHTINTHTHTCNTMLF